MQDTTAVTTLQTGTGTKVQGPSAVLVVAQLSAALLTGCLAVMGPWAVDTIVGRALSGKVGRILSARTEMTVKVGRLRPAGLLSNGKPSLGLVADNVELLDRNLSVAARQVTVTRTAGGTSISVLSPFLTGTAQAVEQVLRRTARPWTDHRTKTSRRSRGSLRRLLGRCRFDLRDGKASLQMGPDPSQHLFLSFGNLRVERDEQGPVVRGALTALLTTPAMSANTGIDHLSIRPDRLPRLGNISEGAAAMLKRMMRSRRGLDWIDAARGRVSLHLSRATASRYLDCGRTCRTDHILGTFKVERLAEGLTNVGFSLTDDRAMARLQALATRDRVAGTWRIQTMFHDIPARVLNRLLPTVQITQGRMDGQGAVGSHGDKLKGKLLLHFDGNLMIRNRLVAERTIPWLGVGMDLSLSVAQRNGAWTARIHKSRLTSKKMRVEILGLVHLRPDRTWLADVTARLDRRPCQDLLDALPPSLVPALEGMQLDGNLGAGLHFRADSRNTDDILAEMDAQGHCIVLRDPPSSDVHKLLRDPVVMHIRDAAGRKEKLVLGPQNRFFRPLKSMPAHLIRAFLITEDRRFFSHQGFDWDQIRRALALDIQRHAVIKGASSISQQVIKNLYLNQHRTLSRKLQEAVLTWRMEQIVPKRRILELYLNLVEMGPGIYGVERGARTYFHKPSKRLTPLESMHLASITPAPRRYYRVFKEKKRVGTAWLTRLRHRMRWMYQFGWISGSDYEKLKNRGLLLAEF